MSTLARKVFLAAVAACALIALATSPHAQEQQQHLDEVKHILA